MKTIFDTTKGEPSTLDFSGKGKSLIPRAVSDVFGNLSGMTHAIVQGNLFKPNSWTGYVSGNTISVEGMISPKKAPDKTKFTHDKKGDQGFIHPAN